MNIITTSTAEAIITEQAARGRPREALGPDDVSHLYGPYRDAGVASGYAPPDFAGARAMLPAADRTLQTREDPVGLIAETREHPALEPVIDEVVSRLDMPVQLFHGRGNAGMVRRGRLGELVESGRLRLSGLEDSAAPLSAPRYNALFLLPEFWRRVMGRGKILVFQTDALLCPASPYGLEDFLEFDYIGSPFKQSERRNILLHGGNGGLSLRDWPKTLECLSRFPPEEWGSAEDRYFAFHMEFVGRVGRFHDCARFAAQREFLYPSFGAHNAREMHPVDQARFLEYCPEAMRILPRAKPPVRSPLRRWKREFVRMWMRWKLDRVSHS